MNRNLLCRMPIQYLSWQHFSIFDVKLTAIDSYPKSVERLHLVRVRGLVSVGNMLNKSTTVITTVTCVHDPTFSDWNCNPLTTWNSTTVETISQKKKIVRKEIETQEIPSVLYASSVLYAPFLAQTRIF